MAQITINEVSSNYGFNIGTNSYATVALPITASWGPGYFDPNTEGVTQDEMLELSTWAKYPATQAGLESFISTYRGPASNYRLTKDYSYQMALTLLTTGYDVLVCRLCPGLRASGQLGEVARYEALTTQPSDWETNYSDYFTYSEQTKRYSAVEGVTVEDYVDIHNENKPEDWDENWASYYTKNASDEYVPNQESTWSTAKAQEGGIYRLDTEVVAPTFVANIYYKLLDDGSDVITFTAKYPGSFGNNLQVVLTKKFYTLEGKTSAYWNMIVYVIDSVGVKTAVENKVFVFELEHSTDAILHWSEVDSNFVKIEATETCTDSMDLDNFAVTLTGGTDRPVESDGETVESILSEAAALAVSRFAHVNELGLDYVSAINNASVDIVSAYNIRYMEWLYTSAVGQDSFSGVLELLDDKLAYNPNRVVSPGWDDQNFAALGSEGPASIVAWEISPLHIALMNCAYYSRCATAYIDIPRSLARSDVYGDEGYAQKLARFTPPIQNINNLLYSSHSALFAPWGQYTYVGTSKQTIASPSFLALMIQRAQILNQSLQYEWALPTNRKHNLKLGKLDYNVPKKLLDIWQKLEGVGVNVIAQIPDLGTNVWGNSTLYEVPPATYQALANLSTRLLVNAIEDVAYKVGISITFQYNNQEAYASFYAGVSPILDTMRNVGAIDDYYVTMSADIDGLNSVNANSVIGKIYITVAGVINDITIDLIALPTSVDLDQYRS